MSEPAAPSAAVVYRARRIRTMDENCPTATHVMVRDGRILAVGERADMDRYGDYRLDETFADDVLVPGLIEAHAHLHEGGIWRFLYLGYHDRIAPDGTRWPGLKTLDAVIERLRAAETALETPDEALLAWGFDPLYFGTERLTEEALDRVSRHRPTAILHASFHLMNVNSAMLELAGIDGTIDIEGIGRHADGRPDGELREFAAMFPVNRAIGNAFRNGSTTREGLDNFAQLAQMAGVTTVTDLNNELGDADVASLAAATRREDFPVRLIPAFRTVGAGQGCDQAISRIREVSKHNHDKLRFGAVKLILDGSIQGFTARLNWPGYHNGHANGIWVTSPQEAEEMIEAYHRAGLQIHIHTNGDEATEVALDALERVLGEHPRPDHRHTLQHVQMASTAQFRRMAQLGLCVNLFSNHLYYWGDAHYALTLGPDRAERMNACATALAENVPFTIHSDAPITPIGPLFTAWCAVNRRTSAGRTLGESQKISVHRALEAITLNAAFTLKMDAEIGSIEVGKRADFCVLDADPLETPPEHLLTINVLATVLGGRAFRSPRHDMAASP